MAEADTPVVLPTTPAINGLVFRRYRSEADFASMAEIINICKAPDGIERSATADGLLRFYNGQTHFDRARDFLYAEVHGLLVGYGAVFWNAPEDDVQIFWHLCFIRPEWRNQGLGTALLHHNERRIAQIAHDQPESGRRSIHIFLSDTEHARRALLEANGYQAARFSFRMLRQLATPIPNLLLPTTMVLRPVVETQFEAIREAINEAFRDHWGNTSLDAEEFHNWASGPNFDPSLWVVAWEGDTVVGTALGEINRAENLEYQRMRGLISTVCVRRPWRKQGVARALMAHAMQRLRNRAMTEIELEVDTQNPSGALQLYESLGFYPFKQAITYEKPLHQ